MTLEEQLIFHEGLRLKPYLDIKGKLTIGVGRNLDDTGITREEALHLLQNDIQRIQKELSFRVRHWDQLSPVRQRVLIDMAFTLGVAGLFKFRKMMTAVEHGKFEKAADEILLSRYATQVKERAKRLANWMRNDRISIKE